MSPTLVASVSGDDTRMLAALVEVEVFRFEKEELNICGLYVSKNGR